MTTSSDLGYAFDLSLPPVEDLRLRLWAEATPGATWDVSGGHVTLARFTGSRPPEQLVPAMRDACAGLWPIDAAFTMPSRQSYWDKPGLEIVMLVGEALTDVAGVLDLRESLIASMSPEGLALLEGGPYRPHVTLTTGLPPADAHRLEAAARHLDLRFTASELVFWCGSETPDPDAPADPSWRVIERLMLGS